MTRVTFTTTIDGEIPVRVDAMVYLYPTRRAPADYMRDPPCNALVDIDSVVDEETGDEIEYDDLTEDDKDRLDEIATERAREVGP